MEKIIKRIQQRHSNSRISGMTVQLMSCPEDKVLVSLLTMSKTLFVQWQGPYQVVCKVGKV